MKEIKSGKKKGRPPSDCDFFKHFKNLAGRDSTVSADGQEEIDRINLNVIETFIFGAR